MRLSILVVIVTLQTVLGSIPAFSASNLYGGRWGSVEEIRSWLYCTMYNCTYYETWPMTKVIRFYLSTRYRHVPAMVKPPTSCTAGGHSSKELFEQLMQLLFGTSTIVIISCVVFLPNTDNSVQVHCRLPTDAKRVVFIRFWCQNPFAFAIYCKKVYSSEHRACIR